MSMEPTWLPSFPYRRRVCPLCLVHSALSVCSARRSCCAAPTGLREVGCRNAGSGLTTLLVPSRPEESWICSWRWKVENVHRGNNSGHGGEMWDTNTGDILEPQQECRCRARRPLWEAAEPLCAAGERQKERKLSSVSITCAEHEHTGQFLWLLWPLWASVMQPPGWLKTVTVEDCASDASSASRCWIDAGSERWTGQLCVVHTIRPSAGEHWKWPFN